MGPGRRGVRAAPVVSRGSPVPDAHARRPVHATRPDTGRRARLRAGGSTGGLMSEADPVIITTPPGEHFHAVRFYENDKSLCRIVADFLGTGLAEGQPAVVVGTPDHRRGIVEALSARGFDVIRLSAAGDLV